MKEERRMQKQERRPTIMTLEEVARFLRLNKSTIYRMAREGTLPAWKLGNVWRFKKEAIEDWIVNSQRAHEKKLHDKS
jgi:excisionase family DNA binding protein